LKLSEVCHDSQGKSHDNQISKSSLAHKNPQIITKLSLPVVTVDCSHLNLSKSKSQTLTSFASFHIKNVQVCTQVCLCIKHLCVVCQKCCCLCRCKRWVENANSEMKICVCASNYNIVIPKRFREKNIFASKTRNNQN
jgi:hypothetical protein